VVFLHSFTLLSSFEASSGSKGSNGLGFLWAFTGKQYRRCGVHRERAQDVEVLTHVETCLRMWVACDSGSVVMKVDTR